MEYNENATSLWLSWSNANQDTDQPMRLTRLEEVISDSRIDDLYTRDLITFSIMGVAGVSVNLLGIVGNIISLIVLSRIQVPLSTYTYLSGLCVSDLCMLLSSLLLLGNDLKLPKRGHHFEDDDTFLEMFPYLNPLAFTFHVISVWLTLAFTLDRYLVICYPFKAQRFCSVAKARKSTAAIFMVGVLLNLPRFFEYRTVEFVFQYTGSGNFSVNLRRVFCDLTELGSSQTFKHIYHSWFYVLCVGCMPFLLIALFNFLLLRTVSRSHRQSVILQRQRYHRRRQDTTVMLIGVVLMFFICQTPALVSRVIWTMETYQDQFKTNPLYTFNEICNFLIILNSAGNIMPYYMFGTRFRAGLLKLFRRKSRTMRRQDSGRLGRSSTIGHRGSGRPVKSSSTIRRQWQLLLTSHTAFGESSSLTSNRQGRLSSVKRYTEAVPNQSNGIQV